MLRSGSLPTANGNGVPKSMIRQSVMKTGPFMPASGSNSAIRKTCDAARHFDRRRALVWLGQALIAGSAAASSAFAQYPSSGQTYSSPYTPPYTPVYMQQARPQPGNQTDEQLLTVGRLLEQQGRYARAQRIYTELERRRLAGFQQPMRMPPNVPFQAPPGMVPQAAVSSGAWQAAPAPMASRGSRNATRAAGQPPHVLRQSWSGHLASSAGCFLRRRFRRANRS